MDDIFDGWLAIPSIAGFLAAEPLDCPKQSLSSIHTQGLISPALDIQPADESSLVAVNNPSKQISSRQRRGHTKSRLGCIGCKQRKVKCQEQWPACMNCTKRGTVCKYPRTFRSDQRDRIVSEIMSPQLSRELSPTPGVFTSEDMQLFHHYLTSAHPCIPHYYKGVWTKDVPILSHQFPYLLEAMLALAGSHLAIHVKNPRTHRALTHRQKAITGLEEAFTRWPPNPQEAHIMLATSYLLSFQSSYMDDAFLEHLTSLRGCALLSQFILQRGLDGPFEMGVQMHSTIMDTAFKDFPHLDQELAQKALQSFKNFVHLLPQPSAHSIERALTVQLVSTIRSLLGSYSGSTLGTPITPSMTEASTLSYPSTPSTIPSNGLTVLNPLFPADLDLDSDDLDYDSITLPLSLTPNPIRAFIAIMSSVTILATWPHATLIHLFEPANQLGNIVMAHLCAVRLLIIPLSAHKDMMRDPIKGIVDWMERLIVAAELHEQVDTVDYLEWPKRILRCLQACLEKKRGFAYQDVREMLVNDPGAFKEGRVGRF